MLHEYSLFQIPAFIGIAIVVIIAGAGIGFYYLRKPIVAPIGAPIVAPIVAPIGAPLVGSINANSIGSVSLSI